LGGYRASVTAEDFKARLGRLESTKYEELRLAQAHILDAYAGDHADSADVAIELPTGVGKTLIALLLADHALDRGWSVAYLAGSNVLAEQVEAEAQELPGLVAHRFWGGHYPGSALDDYHQAQALGIMNYWVYFNASPKVEPADLVIFDDAHLAEQPLTSLFAARIGRTQHPELFARICDIVLAHTGAYETLPAMRDGTVPASAPPELLAFNDWDAVSGLVMAAVDDSTYADSEQGVFVWRELRGRLTRCGVLIGANAIEIRPYHPPSQILPGVSRSKQRIYMSATLGSMDDLERRLGIGPITRIDVPPELHAGSTGRRMFALNPGLDSSFAQPLTKLVLDLAAERGRVAWLCSSHYEADQVQGALTSLRLIPHRLRPGDDSALVAWRRSTNGHLIAAGRFDGLDFAGDICRLVVLPSVPAASSEFERFVVAYLGDASFMRHRIGQRVTQALGRANRLPTDWAIYAGLDPAFAGMLAQPAVRGAMDPGVSAVIRQSLELHTEGWDATEAAIRSFWAGTDEVASEAPRRRPGRAAVGPSTSQSASAEVASSTALWLGDYEGAAAQAAVASELLAAAGESEHSAFWRYVEAHAMFAAGGSHAMTRAAGAISEAVTSGPRTSWFVRLQRTLDDLQGRTTTQPGHEDLFLTWDTWLRESGARVQRDLTRARAMLDGTHDERAIGLLTLARLSGAWADRPTGSSATDVRWTWVARDGAERRVWEIKTGRASERVPRNDINQLLGQLQIESQDHPKARVLGCLLTTYADMEDDAAAAAREKVTIIHDSAAGALFDALTDRLLAYQTLWGGGSAEERGRARSAVEPRLPAAGWLRRLLSPSAGRVIQRSDVEGIFRA
jgi:hypothetical protein